MPHLFYSEKKVYFQTGQIAAGYRLGPQAKPPSGRLWRDLLIARPGEENASTVAGASGRVSLRAAGAAKLLLRTKTQTTLSLTKL